MSIVSLFSGAGGLDLGFHHAGFNTIWANEFDRKIHPTFAHNFPDTFLDTRSIVDVSSDDVPDCDGIIGGPPCQSWSIAGASRGLNDPRGLLFYEYVRILKAKKPMFFVAENVPGMINRTHLPAFLDIISALEKCGYNVSWTPVDAYNYGVAQNRSRVIIVGYHKDCTNKTFKMPEEMPFRRTLRDVIWDLWDSAVPGHNRTRANDECYLSLPNHEYYVGTFPPRYMSRNRVRPWDKPSFTMVARVQGCPAHPDSGRMIRIDRDHHYFEFPDKARYMSIRETARIQSFPDEFKFIYTTLEHGYKMTGNAVPPTLARLIALQIKRDLGISYGWWNTRPFIDKLNMQLEGELMLRQIRRGMELLYEKAMQDGLGLSDREVELRYEQSQSVERLQEETVQETT